MNNEGCCNSWEHHTRTTTAVFAERLQLDKHVTADMPKLAACKSICTGGGGEHAYDKACDNSWLLFDLVGMELRTPHHAALPCEQDGQVIIMARKGVSVP